MQSWIELASKGKQTCNRAVPVGRQGLQNHRRGSSIIAVEDIYDLLKTDMAS